MRRQSNFSLIITVVTVAVTVAATVASFVVLLERKRRNDEELERYLDGSIQ
jgi:NADH:ubiquinone oxidoreductase subunit 3 (subunit A)